MCGLVMSLNPEQEKAVRTPEGRILILAGAGSGKTRVIVHRIAHLVCNLEKKPESILGMTFTNKAALEMRHRVQELIGASAAKKVTLCTFHSFCMQVLRREIHRLGYTRDFSLYDESDMRRLINKMARDALNCHGELPSLKSTFAAVTRVSQQNTQTQSGEKEGSWHDDFSRDLHEKLQTTMRAYNAVNFDSLITLTIQLFEQYPDVLNSYQERYQYLMVDEYQDTNLIQVRLAELLAQKHSNLCVVGDDDQSIYGWRGAEIKNILDFKADTVITLEQNYRSAMPILAAANAVIQHNCHRHPKKLWSRIESSEPIEIFNVSTDIEEAQAVIDRLLHFRQVRGMRWSDMAILYRSNALSRHFESALMRACWQNEGHWVRGIPYEIYGGLSFSERSEIKDLFAYLRLMANPNDGEALLRIINVPRRGISDTFLDQVTQNNRRTGTPLWEVLEQISCGRMTDIGTSRAQNAVRAFVSLIQTYRRRFQSEPLAETLLAFIEEIQYKKAIEEEAKSEQIQQFKWENVQECISALAQYQQEMTDNGDSANLLHFVANTTLANQPVRTTTNHYSDRLQMMTLHSAKGLEFPACFIVGLEDHILPHEKSRVHAGVEEERRLFYVGITRAQRYLTLSMARLRMQTGKYIPTTPSRFLHEIPQHLLRVTMAKAF
jgi:DNA helicase-2/ATP-dependent DNA helicase PcrA